MRCSLKSPRLLGSISGQPCWMGAHIISIITSACVISHFSHVRLFATPWTIACQDPLSMGFSRQEYWGGLPCLPSADLFHLRIKLASLISPELAVGIFTTSATWEAPWCMRGHSVLKIIGEAMCAKTLKTANQVNLT